MATRRKPVRQGEQLAALAAEFQAHAEEDTRRVVEVNVKLDDIGSDVKSLLASRQFSRGFLKAVLLVAGGAGGAGGLIVAVVKALWN